MAKKIFNIITTVLLVVLVAVVVMVFVSRVSGNSPSFFGYHVFRVSSGSMEPTLAIEDVILVKHVAPEEIHEGDIITYNGQVGEFNGKMITHMVIEEPYEEDGVWHIQTQGIAEGTLKDPQITYDQVQGKYLATLGVMTKLYRFFLSPAGLIAFVAVIIGLFGYEMISIILSYRSIDEHDDDYYEPKAKKKSRKRKK